MRDLAQLVQGLILAAFIALKVAGVTAWSWWWVLMPTVPVIAAALGYTQ